MKRPNILGKTRDTITKFKPGSVFSASDFSDISDSAKIGVALSRLEKEGLIKKILHGIYVYPEYNSFLGECIEPDPNDVAHAIARKFGWTIVPYGDTALNILGLSTQVPSVWIYVCDGAYKKYTYKKIMLEFKKTTNKEISKLSYKTALVIQAIKAIGKDGITEGVIKQIREKLSTEEKISMLKEAKFATSWVYVVIKQICEDMQ